MQNLKLKSKFSKLRFSTAPLHFCAWACLFVTIGLPALASALDWPTYRRDNTRSGVTAEALPVPLSLQWTIKSPHPPVTAWPQPAEELPRMHTDNAFHVTAADGTAYFGSSVVNKVYAVDINQAQIRWAFSTAGPVRFAPTIDSGRVYFGSDDGCVYCLNASDAKLIWKYRAGPSEEKVIGSGRMISSWPVRTSVLVDNGQALFAAGVFPFEGIYICSLNAADGSVIWKNDTIGDRAHDLQFGGISPQGYLLASQTILYVPSGRATPAAFDRNTGNFLYYTSPDGKRGGTWALLDNDKLIAGVEDSGAPAKTAYDAKTGRSQGAAYAWFPGIDMILTPDFSYTLSSSGIYALNRAVYADAENKANAALAQQRKLNQELTKLREDLDKTDETSRTPIEQRIDQLTQEIHQLAEVINTAQKSSFLWHYPKDNLCSLILTGSVIWAGGQDFIVALDALTGRELWTENISGGAYGLAAADQHLFVSTDHGNIYCFGKNKVQPRQIKTFTDSPFAPPADLDALYRRAAEKIIHDSGITKGYGLVLDCGEGMLALELARKTDLRIIGIEKDAKLCEIARQNLEAAGFLGDRAAVESWDLADLPPYFANLIVSDRMLITGLSAASAQDWYRLLRPYGGVALFGLPRNGEIKWNKINRGPLEGAGNWSALYANPQNTACSEDELVKGPFGLLWYGEPGPQEMVERHARAVSPVSSNGRLFHQGEEVIMAYDAYNGTFLWKKYIPGAVRVRADVDGGNLALTDDALYVAAYDKCYRLDPATGETLSVYDLPACPDGSPRRWGYIAVLDNIIYGVAAEPLERDYAAFWKDFVNPQTGQWKSESEINPETLKRWQTNRRYPGAYEALKARYPIPDENLKMEFQRAGTFWRSADDYPSWSSQRSARNTMTNSLMAGDLLFALDAETAKTLWTYQGKRIPNIAVSIADGSVFLVESEPTDEQIKIALEDKKSLIEKGIYEPGKETEVIKTPADADVRLAVALDAATGKVRWQKPLDLTGCGGDKMGSAYQDGVLLFFGHFSNHDTGFFLNNELTWRRITALDAQTAQVLWSRPLNYLRRPLIVGDTVIIEPRACDLKTGRIKTRNHPISGQEVEWEFLRPGHCCSITSASAHALLYRSYNAAIYDLTADNGISMFGAIRPGCWLNMIAAGGLMLMPEASSGCTCSYPLRCSIALVSKPKITDNWTVFVTHGPMTPVARFAINFGAPGDMKANDGTLWFAYPRPRAISGIGYGEYGVKFNLKEKFASKMGFFGSDYRGAKIAGSDKPWLFTSGTRGMLRCELPLIDDSSQPPATYTLRLGFAAPAGDRPGQRVFDVIAQGRTILADFDIIAQTGAADTALTKEIKGIKVDNFLVLEFAPKAADPAADQAPLINFIEVIKEAPSDVTQG